MLFPYTKCIFLNLLFYEVNLCGTHSAPPAAEPDR